MAAAGPGTISPSLLDWPDQMDDVSYFFQNWLRNSKDVTDTRRLTIKENAGNIREFPRAKHINAEDLRGDTRDAQGFDMRSLGVTRADARAIRHRFLRALHRLRQELSHGYVLGIPSFKAEQADTYFRAKDIFHFRRMNTRPRPWIGHRQLRHMLAVSSHHDLLYAEQSRVVRLDPLDTHATCVLDLSSAQLTGVNDPPAFVTTTINASSEVVIAGSFHGHYALASMSEEASGKPHIGTVTRETMPGEVCHIDLYAHRHSAGGAAAFCSNDRTVRTLDLTTNRFTSASHYDWAPNVTATDPSGQLRLIAGDSSNVLITAADSGEVLVALNHHRLVACEGVFGASWSAANGGRYVATAAEDACVLVYDARRWSEPVARLRPAEESCVRSVKFSPDGRWLLMAGAEDTVRVLDVGQGMFDGDEGRRGQEFDFFGRVAGVAWRPGGDGFWAAVEDAHWGGLMDFEMDAAHCAGRDRGCQYRGHEDGSTDGARRVHDLSYESCDDGEGAMEAVYRPYGLPGNRAGGQGRWCNRDESEFAASRKGFDLGALML